ncbi:MAG: hypothetical protein JNK33_05915, partial [Candidatus Doudnabacteria bacterium]|nr:hypothetical protein [Candidatus Doudnabacteria bacterium]
MKKNVSQSINGLLRRHSRVALLTASSLILVSGAILPAWRQVVLADQYQDQINALQTENANNRAALDGLESQAESYADAILKLQQQIDGLQHSIDENMKLQADLQRQIAEAQAEIDRQRAILASDVKAMYVDGNPSSLEMLATSKNLSDFVDKQEYRSR